MVSQRSEQGGLADISSYQRAYPRAIRRPMARRYEHRNTILYVRTPLMRQQNMTFAKTMYEIMYMQHLVFIVSPRLTRGGRRGSHTATRSSTLCDHIKRIPSYTECKMIIDTRVTHSIGFKMYQNLLLKQGIEMDE